MPSSRATRAQRVFEAHEQRARQALEAGVSRRLLEDERLEGPIITLDGRRMVNFGSCSYLGLNLDPRVKEAARDAVERFGVIHSSSSAYTSIGLYRDLEAGLSEITGGHVVVTPTTTLGHLSALPVLVVDGDHVLVDAQAHASLHLTTRVLTAQGAPVDTVPHNDMEALEAAIVEALRSHDRVWYLADGLYSMFGDPAPVEAVHDLLERHENLWVYFDDAHGFSWHGRHGRGIVLERMPMHPRMVVALSLVKSFGSGGGALAFGDPALAGRVRLVGAPLTFSGPLQIAELGGGVASVGIHLSDEHPALQRRLLDQIDLVRRTSQRLGLPMLRSDSTPIWFIRVGRMEHTLEVIRRLMSDGFYTNVAAFPAVPIGYAGIRFTHTLLNTDDQIVSMLERLAHHHADVVGGDLHITIDLREVEQVEAGGAASAAD